MYKNSVKIVKIRISFGNLSEKKIRVNKFIDFEQIIIYKISFIIPITLIYFCIGFRIILHYSMFFEDSSVNSWLKFYILFTNEAI